MEPESTTEWNRDGAGGAETTHAAPADEPETTASETTRVDGSELAWSLDDTDEAQLVRHGRVVTAGLAALVAGVAATGIWLGSTYFSWPASKHVAPSGVPATSTTAKPAAAAPSAPPPATVTVTPPAPAPPPAPPPPAPAPVAAPTPALPSPPAVRSNITQQQADTICRWLRDPAWTMGQIEMSTGDMLANDNLSFTGTPDILKAISAAMSGTCPDAANQRPL